MLRRREDTLGIEEHPLSPFYYCIILSSNASYPKTGARKSKECDLPVVKDQQGVVHKKPRSKGVKDAKKLWLESLGFVAGVQRCPMDCKEKDRAKRLSPASIRQ